MHSRFNNTIHIGVSRTGIALLRTSGWLRPRSQLLCDLSFTFTEPDQLAARLGSALSEARCSKMRASVILADDWTRLFMVTPPNNTTRLQDCRIAAEMRFQSLYGESSSDWRIEADWHVGHPFLACALPKKLLQALHQAVAEHRMNLIAITPHFIAAWNRWRGSLKPNAWFGVAHANMLTLGAMDREGLCAVRAASVPLDGWTGNQWLQQHIAREALRLTLPVPGQIQLCGDVPGHWTMQAMGTSACERLDATQRTLDSAPPSPAAMLARTGVCR